MFEIFKDMLLVGFWLSFVISLMTTLDLRAESEQPKWPAYVCLIFLTAYLICKWGS